MNNQKYKKRMRILRWSSLFSCILFLATGWIVFDTLFLPRGETGETVEIPDFVGQRPEAAEKYRWLDLRLEYRYDASVGAGTVLSQSPAAGSLRKISELSPRCPLTLTVSLGEETAVLPNLIGRDARQAEADLRAAGFPVETVKQSGAYPAGTVYAVEPRIGTELPVGTKVTLYVSTGSPILTVTVPELRGLSRGDALVKLWLSQLAAGDVVETDSTEPEGTVIRQSHQPGTLTAAGTKITIYVSRQNFAGIEE